MNITLETLHLATEQQVFEKVATHLLTQNAKSYGEGVEANRCMYRGDEGRMCAAGCLIADGEYNYNMEGKKWTASTFPQTHRFLIRELQQIHDEHDVEFWPESLKSLATEWGLSTDFMGKFK